MSRKRNNTNSEQAKINKRIYNDFYDRLKNLALSVFEWVDLPQSMNERFLEKCLFENGCALVGDSKLYGILNLRATPNGQMNIYENYTGYTGYSIGYSQQFKENECVYIRNNKTATSTSLVIDEYCRKLTNLEIAIQGNLRNQRFPVICTMDESQRLTYENILEKFEGGVPFIMADKNFDSNTVKVFDTKTPLIVNALLQAKIQIWNECISYLGINNANTEKRERLISDEVNANNELLESHLSIMLSERELGCKKINEMFGLNISVKKRIGVEQSGKLHSAITEFD